MMPAVARDHAGVRYSFEGPQADQEAVIGSLQAGFPLALFAIFALLAIPLGSGRPGALLPAESVRLAALDGENADSADGRELNDGVPAFMPRGRDRPRAGRFGGLPVRAPELRRAPIVASNSTSRFMRSVMQAWSGVRAAGAGAGRGVVHPPGAPPDCLSAMRRNGPFAASSPS